MEIKYDRYLDSLQDDDVLEQPIVKEPKYLPEKLIKIQKIRENLKSALDSVIPGEVSRRLETFNTPNDLFLQGSKCRILQSHSNGWKSGKIRINVSINIEFIPDELEPESPLDEIRREISQINKVES